MLLGGLARRFHQAPMRAVHAELLVDQDTD
jgi:hypothetical protein